MPNENNNNQSTEYDESASHHSQHPPTLDEVQLQAYRVHHRHGGAFGGYTLDDWLEAEHELCDSDCGAESPDGC